MSKMNVLRLVNLNYNNNAIHVDDESFRFEGASTLMCLRNGGGKSVLVQMMIAPFVRKRYRNTEDRTFQSFFTTNKPSFIMVEWSLDGGMGYVLTGMMVRKSQSTNEADEKEELEIINFISEYKQPCKWDINHLSIVEETKKQKTLKGFGYCRQLFETLKKDNRADFNYYDMNNGQQSRRYFEKLKEYQIDYKEWESIIKKINVKESGLSDLFKEAKDEKGLVEKWFLDAVENKLNREKRRMKEFETLVLKYIRQYKENQSKIQRKDTIARFREEAVPVRECAKEYQEAVEIQQEHENRIANLIAIYQTLWEEAAENKAEIQDTICSIEAAMAKLEHEEISLQIYQLEDDKELLIRDCEENEMTREQVRKTSSDIEQKLHIQECAKCYEEYQEASKEQQLYESRIEIAKKNETELEPERNRIGYNLKCRYEERMCKIKDSLERLEVQMNQYQEEEKRLNGCMKENRVQQGELERRQGGLQQGILHYDEVESAYNTKYREQLMRNILGEYEVDTLELLNQQYVQNMEQLLHQLTDSRKKKENYEEDKRRIQKELDENQKEAVILSETWKRLTKEQNGYDSELKERITMMKYVDLPEADVFDKEKIIQAFERKITDLQLVRDALQREAEKLFRDCDRLKQGNVLELPKDFQEALDALGIHYVYGMKWLEKNGRSTAENEYLIDQNPFIPYAIILGEAEIAKLQTQHLELYTSFPIPIVKRTELEQVYERNQNYLEGFSKVSFFVMFNKNLLDTEKLALLIQEKEVLLRKKEEQLQRKDEELENYRVKKAYIHQSVSKEIYDRCVNERKEAERKKASVDIVIDQILKEQSDTVRAYELLLTALNKLEQEVMRQQDQMGAFGNLCERYRTYQEQTRELECIRGQILKCHATYEEADKDLEAIRVSLNEAVQSRESQKSEYSETAKHALEFSRYEEDEFMNKDMEDLEARYKAITEQISNDLKQLEEQYNNSKRRYEKYETELIRKTDKFKLMQTDYDQVIYDRFVERQLEKEQKAAAEKLQGLEAVFHELDKQITRLEVNIKNRMDQMHKQYGQTELVPRGLITAIDFKSRMLVKRQEKKKADEQMAVIQERMQSFETSLSVFAEYTEFSLLREVTFTESFTEMTAKELSNYNGTAGRDYRQSIKEAGRAQGKLRDAMNRMVRMEVFEDEFYKKPMEKLIALIEDAHGFVQQLDTILDSYQSLMEKLQVDIAFIDKEKEQVHELMLDYLKEVHKNLEKIDKNSTINIRGKSIKMLKLILPDWEENADLYTIRMRDFLEQLTVTILTAIDKNENIEELAGKHVTTRNLYNEVVGIGNVEVKLYKIEEQRQYPITWAEVSRNSGGEGFLSAFVILSSLLYYMRRGEADVFGEREEGKVLVMDNPFAQTNSAHLLKPLMDVADKTNTQLICLTGLGGDSIYSRFDNIYVMNLVSSMMRKDMQYMKTEHIKGAEDEEAMVLSRMKTEDEVQGEYEQGRLF